MAELPTPIQVVDLVSLLAPGLIISAIRVRAVTVAVPDFKERLLSYGLISVGYFAAITPLFHVKSGAALAPWLWSFLQYFLIPCIIGIALAYAYQGELSYRIAGWAKLHLAHHLPAAWDYVFEKLPAGTFVLVTLDDGTQIAGRMNARSFAASSREERDLSSTRFGKLEKMENRGLL